MFIGTNVPGKNPHRNDFKPQDNCCSSWPKFIKHGHGYKGDNDRYEAEIKVKPIKQV